MLPCHLIDHAFTHSLSARIERDTLESWARQPRSLLFQGIGLGLDARLLFEVQDAVQAIPALRGCAFVSVLPPRLFTPAVIFPILTDAVDDRTIFRRLVPQLRGG